MEINDRCGDCEFFNNDPEWIEAAFPGLNSLSSAYASVRAEAGTCSRRGLFLPPWKESCRYFKHIERACIPSD